MSSPKLVVSWMGVAVVLLVGCSGATNDNDFFRAPSEERSAPEDPPKQGCGSYGCSASETLFTSETACTSSGRTCRAVDPGCGKTVWCGKLTAQCTALPACEADDEEVTTCPKNATCYSKTVCGTTILCQKPFANCDAYPACDAGDVKALDETSCKKAGACYSRTLCGTTIWCVDKL